MPAPSIFETVRDPLFKQLSPQEQRDYLTAVHPDEAKPLEDEGTMAGLERTMLGTGSRPNDSLQKFIDTETNRQHLKTEAGPPQVPEPPSLFERMGGAFAAAKNNLPRYTPPGYPDQGIKGPGFNGRLALPGGFASEYSIPLDEDRGDLREIPVMVPELSAAERAQLPDLIAGNKQLPRGIIDKARASARARIKEGKSPFYGPEDYGLLERGAAALGGATRAIERTPFGRAVQAVGTGATGAVEEQLTGGAQALEDLTSEAPRNLRKPGVAADLRERAALMGQRQEEALAGAPAAARLAARAGAGIIGTLPAIALGTAVAGPPGGAAAFGASGFLSRYGQNPEDVAGAAKGGLEDTAIGFLLNRFAGASRATRAAVGGATGLAGLEHGTPEDATEQGLVNAGLFALLGGRGRPGRAGLEPSAEPFVHPPYDPAKFGRRTGPPEEPPGGAVPFEPPQGPMGPRPGVPGVPTGEPPPELETRPADLADKFAAQKAAQEQERRFGPIPPGAVPMIPGEPAPVAPGAPPEGITGPPHPGESAPLALYPEGLGRAPTPRPGGRGGRGGNGAPPEGAPPAEEAPREPTISSDRDRFGTPFSVVTYPDGTRREFTGLGHAREAKDALEDWRTRAAWFGQQVNRDFDVEPPAPRPEPVPEPAAEAAPAGPPAPAPVPGAIPNSVKLPGGGDVPIRYELAELDDLIPSHTTSFTPNPRYPEGVQPRAYHRTPEEQAKVIENAKHWNAEFVYSDTPGAEHGPPIVTPAGVVLGGNSRTLSAMYVAEGRAGEGVRARMKATTIGYARRFGLDPEQARGMRHPIIVRRMAAEPGSTQESAELARRMNESFTQAVTPIDNAVALAKSLSPESMTTLGTLLDQAGEDATVRGVLGTDRSFAEALQRDGIITEHNRNLYIDGKTNRLNDRGLDLAEELLLGKVIPDGDLIHAMPASWRDKIARSVPAVVRADSAPSTENWPTLASLLEGAARSEVRRQATGENLDDWLAQGELLNPAPSQADPRVAAIHHLLHENSPLVVKSRLAAYANRAVELRTQAPALFAPDTEQAAFEEAILGHPMRSEATARAEAAESQLRAGSRVRVTVTGGGTAEGTIGAIKPDGSKIRIDGIPKKRGAGSKSIWVSPSQIISTQPPAEGLLQMREGVQAAGGRGMFGPGWSWLPFRDADLVPPDSPLPSRLVERSQPLVRLARAFQTNIRQGGTRLRSSQGRLPQDVLGYYELGKGTLRMRRWGDIQTASHELFHMLAERYPDTFGRLSEMQAQRRPGQPVDPIQIELHGLSYNMMDAREGYAEGGRLWFTNPEKLRDSSPLTYAAFESAVDALPSKQRGAMRRAQREMVEWFEQGAKATLESKIGPAKREIANDLPTIAARIRMHLADASHGLMEAERRIWGSTQPDGPTETIRRLRGVGELSELLRFKGVPQWIGTPGHSELRYVGKGFQEILDPIYGKSRATARAFWRYATARQADELARQGRERLFSKNEITQGLAEGAARPEFQRVFEDLKEFQSRVADFAQSSGLFTQEMRDRWNREEYAFAFFRELGARVPQRHRGGDQLGFEGSPVWELRGSTRNIRAPLDSLVSGPMRLLQLSFENLANRQVVREIIDRPGGGFYGQRLPPEKVPTRVSAPKLQQALRDEWKRLGLQGIEPKPTTPDWLEFLTLWNQEKPHGNNILSVLEPGRSQPSYVELFDGTLLPEAMRSMRRASGAVPWLAGLRRLKQSSITIDPAFMYGNAVRDLPMALISTKSGALRFLKNAGKGYWAAASRNETYWDAILHGMGQSTHAETGARLGRSMEREARSWLDPRKSLSPLNLFRVLEYIGRSVELGPRLTEFISQQELGMSKRHAAFAGREITTDFGGFGLREGDKIARTMAFIQDTVPFFNAMTQSLDRVYRLAARDPHGKLAFATKAALVPLASMALYLVNRDNPEYQKFNDEQKDLNWHYFFPKSHLPRSLVNQIEASDPATLNSDYVHLMQPKFWEVGALGSIGERALAELDKHDPHLFAHVAAIIAQNFGLQTQGRGGLPIPVPILASEFLEQWANRRAYGGAPIIPGDIEDVSPYAQIRSRQGPTAALYGEGMRRIGLGETPLASPTRAEAFLRGMLGAMAGYGLELSDQALEAGGGAPRVAPHPDEFPLLRRLYARPGKNDRTDVDYYDLRDAIAPPYKTWRKAEELGKPELRQTTPRETIMVGKLLDRADQQIGKINQRIRALRKGTVEEDLTPSQRRDEAENLELRKRRIQQGALDRAQSIGVVP